jgi:uncharacterized protein YbjT (DUF2867 family)
MQVFVTGANGFIGGAVAAALIAAGHKVRGLVRNKAKASAVAAHDVQAVVGSLDDAALLQAEAHAADAVVNAASSDHRDAVEALIAGPAPANPSSIPAAAASWPISPWASLQIESFMRAGQSSRNLPRPLV